MRADQRLPWAGVEAGSDWQGPQGTFWAEGNVLFLGCGVVVTQMCALVRTHRTVLFKCIHSIVYKLWLHTVKFWKEEALEINFERSLQYWIGFRTALLIFTWSMNVSKGKLWRQDGSGFLWGTRQFSLKFCYLISVSLFYLKKSENCKANAVLLL